MFQITEFTEARVTSVTNRVEKHGDDEVPAVSLTLEIEAANTLLDAIDPGIRQSLYKPVEGQDQLPGVEPATPVLRCNSFDKVTLTTAHEGWTLAVDDNIDENDPMLFGGCKVDKFAVDAKQGGSIVLRFRVGTSDVDADKLGQLAMHNGQTVWVNVTPPEKKADETVIDGTKGHPGAGAAAAAAAAGQGDLLAGQQTPEQALADAAGGTGGAGDDAEGAEGSADAGDAAGAEAHAGDDAEAFEAGAAQAIKAAGVKPKKEPAKARGRSDKRTVAVE